MTRWVAVERGGKLVYVPGSEELEVFDDKYLESVKDMCHSERVFSHPKLAPTRFVYLIDARELKLIRAAARHLETILTRMTVHYRGTVDLRPRLFQLLKKIGNGTLTADDLPKTWRQLDLEDVIAAQKKVTKKKKSKSKWNQMQERKEARGPD